jgi:hypothetical protein
MVANTEKTGRREKEFFPQMNTDENKVIATTAPAWLRSR